MKIVNWFIKSSADPQKLSLTLKALVGFAVLFGIDGAVANEGVGHVVLFVTALGQIVSAGFALYGFGRKIYLSVK